MKNILLVLISGLFACSCSLEPSRNNYDNPEIGLHFSYSKSWKVMKEDALDEVITALQDKKELPQEILDQTREFSPLIVISLMKPHRINGVNKNPSINVLVLPVPEDEWSEMDLDQIMPAQISETRNSIPGVEIKPNAFPLSKHPEIHNYSSRIPLSDRVVSQFQYAYWRPPYFVQIAFGYSDPSDENEIREIIESLRID